MGALIYFVNSTKKEYFCPDYCKLNEVYLNSYLMAGIIDILYNEWNGCKIYVLSSYDKRMEKVREEYKDLKIEWNDYREYVR